MRILALLVTMTLLACSPDSSDEAESSEVRERDENTQTLVVSLRLVNAPDTLLVGEETLFVVYAEFDDGTSERANDYRLSTTSHVFELVSEQRLVAQSPGHGVVRIEARGVGVDVEIEVLDDAPTSMKILPEQFTMEEGTTFQLVAEYRNVAGVVVDAPVPEWTVVNHNVISIDEDGVLTAMGAGQSTVIARSEGGLESESKIFVEAFRPDALLITPKVGAELELNESQVFTVQGQDMGIPREFVGNVRWSVEGDAIELQQDPDNDREVTVVARRIGDARLIARSEGRSYSVPVLVRPIGHNNTTRYQTYCAHISNGQPQVTQTFDSLSRLSETLDTIGRTHITYDGTTSRMLLREYDDGDDGSVEYHETYSYDVADRVVASELRDASDGTLIEAGTWEYLDANDSTMFRRIDPEGRLSGWVEKTYDDRGNLIGVNSNNSSRPVVLTYDAIDRLTKVIEYRRWLNFVDYFDRIVVFDWIDEQTATTRVLNVYSFNQEGLRGVGDMMLDKAGNVLRESRFDGASTTTVDYDYTCQPPPPIR